MRMCRRGRDEGASYVRGRGGKVGIHPGPHDGLEATPSPGPLQMLRHRAQNIIYIPVSVAMGDERHRLRELSSSVVNKV